LSNAGVVADDAVDTLHATDWIICLGGVRDVRAAGVDCPLRNRPTPVATCVQCRHLAWRRDERDRPAPCATSETSADP